MKSFKELLKESYENVPLNESSVGRVAYHVKGSNIAIITAHRGNKTAAENNTRNEELKKLISKEGYGYVRVKGHYVEGYGSPSAKDVNENAFLIIGKRGADGGKLLSDARKWGEHFDQDSILHKKHDEERAHLYGTSKSEDSFPGYSQKFDVGTFHPQRAGEFYTALNSKKTFTFSESFNENKVEYIFQENYFKAKERAEQLYFSIR